MSETTPNLRLPYIAAAQAQKHVTHNEAIRALDTLVQLSVIDHAVSAPPSDPGPGDCYIVPDGATGAWAGKDGHVAAFQDGAWLFYEPQEGWLAFSGASGQFRYYLQTTGWQELMTGGSVNPTPLAGINATADTTNRLTVAAPAALFNHEGSDHRLKVNKASPGDTASIVFQTGFSGRAEMGLNGQDDYSFKVSPDGSAWHDAIVIDRTDGSVTFPNSNLGSGGGATGIPSGGATGQVLAKASATDFDVAWTTPATGASGPAYPMHTDGLISEWYFDEATGTTARDVRGSNDIVFDAAFQSAYNSTPVWTRRGLMLELDLIQTPSIPSVRTVAILYRVKRNTPTGFLFSGGPSSGHGVTVGSVPLYYDCVIGGGGGVAPIYRRQDVGTGAFRLNRGGWQILFVDLNQAYTSVLGFGGRHGWTEKNPTYRSAEYEIAWAACWNDVLTDAERQTVYESVRKLAADRSLLLDWRDASQTYDCALLWGQSNASGRALIANLPSSHINRTHQRHVHIQTGVGLSTDFAGPELLVMGENQTGESAGSQFGPEMGAAWRHEDRDNERVRPLAISKTTRGGMWLAPSGANGVPVALTWHPDEVATSAMFGLALKNWWDLEHRLLGNVIGPRPRAIWWMQGEQDATNATTAANYQTHLQALKDAFTLYTGHSPIWVVGRIRDQGPSMVHAAAVRQGQADFVAANPGEALLIDTDDLVLGDGVHYDADGMKTLGERFYDAMGI